MMRQGYQMGNSRSGMSCPQRSMQRTEPSCPARQDMQQRSTECEQSCSDRINNMRERGRSDRMNDMRERGCSDRMSDMRERGCSDRMSDMRERGCSDRMSDMQERDCSCDIPTGSRKQLLCFINEVSFAVYDTLLYLDTHPEDKEAMAFFREHNRLRNRALQEYARLYGPLVIATADNCNTDCWEWMNQPWPWEGGDC